MSDSEDNNSVISVNEENDEINNNFDDNTNNVVKYKKQPTAKFIIKTNINDSDNEDDTEDNINNSRAIDFINISDDEDAYDEVDDDDNDEISQYGGDNDSDEEAENDNDNLEINNANNLHIEDSDTDDDDDDNEEYLQKFNNDNIKNYINDFHPECIIHNSKEIEILTIITRNDDDTIIDPLHKTIPFLTKYERARVLGQRAKQIEHGSNPFVDNAEHIIDSYLIAQQELNEKKIPFIIKRPLPGNSGCEYWKLADLELIIY